MTLLYDLVHSALARALIPIGFTDFPYALRAHDQGAHPPLLHYHHMDTVSVSFLVRDLRTCDVQSRGFCSSDLYRLGNNGTSVDDVDLAL
jgi:hypothetical protein